MTDKQFMIYLFDTLMARGEMICEKCAYNERGFLCENLKQNLETKICIKGIRAYAESDKK